MKKILLCFCLALAAFLLPLNAEAVNGGKEAQELWQKISDNGKNLKNGDCDLRILLNTTYNKTKYSIPVLYKITFWQNPLQGKVFMGALLPGGMPINLDYYLIENKDNFTVYFKTDFLKKNSPWQKLIVPKKEMDENEVKKFEEKIEAILDKSITVKLKGEENINGRLLNNMQITLANKAFYDILILITREKPDSYSDASLKALESMYKDYISKVGDFTYNVWVDKDGTLYRTAFDLKDNIKKLSKLLEDIAEKSSSEKDKKEIKTILEMLKTTTITSESTYYNHNKAAEIILPEEVKNAQAIAFPEPAPAKTEPAKK